MDMTESSKTTGLAKTVFQASPHSTNIYGNADYLGRYNSLLHVLNRLIKLHVISQQ
jgi:hypothetical protein